MDSLSLIAASQQGDEVAVNRLLRLIEKEHMPGRLRKYRNRNVLVQMDDIQSEFLMGCWKAIKQAKLDIGNPLHFICWKGELAVLHLFRKNIKEGVRVNCTTCGVTSVAYRKREGSKEEIAAASRRGVKAKLCCSKCGATDVTTFMVVYDQSQVDEATLEGTPVQSWDRIDPSEVKDTMDDMFSAITYDMKVAEIRSKLNGRVRELFDMLIVKQINRDTSKNYLEEIANEWGVTTACVSVYLRKLRGKVLEHIEVEEAA